MVVLVPHLTFELAVYPNDFIVLVAIPFSAWLIDYLMPQIAML